MSSDDLRQGFTAAQTFMSYPVSTDDPEIQALEVTTTVLNNLEPEVAARVARYLAERYSDA